MKAAISLSLGKSPRCVKVNAFPAPALPGQHPLGSGGLDKTAHIWDVRRVTERRRRVPLPPHTLRKMTPKRIANALPVPAVRTPRGWG
jgi:hypothetical protein